MNKLSLRLEFILLTFIVIIGFFLRFYRLDSLPNGLYQDETSIGYNAYSILTTGNDEYGKKMPLYFKSFGDQKLPVYIYSTVVSEYFFGINAFAVRFPSAFFGSLTIIALYFFVRLLTKDSRIALTSSFLYSINPWALHYNRATFEVSICLFLFILGGYLLIKSFEKKAFGLFITGTVLFIVCLYTYNLTRLLSPLLYTIILLIYRKSLRQISKKELFTTAIISVILLLPFAFSFFNSGGANSAKGTFIFTSNAVKAPLLEYRSYFIFYQLFSKIFLNSYFMLFWQYLNNLVLYFSTPFFIVSGSAHGNHGIGNAGLFYVFEFPLIISGCLLAFKNKAKKGYILLFSWVIVTIMVAALTRDVPQATRSFFLVFPVEVFSALGLIFVLNFIKDTKLLFLKISISAILFSFALYSIVFYFSSYYVRFPILYAKNWKSEDKKIVDYLIQNEDKYSKIIFDKKSGFIYSSLLFYSKYSPSEFYSQVKRLPDDNEGFSEVVSFGKYEFKDVDWSKDFVKGTLIVTSRDNQPKEFPSIASFDYPLRPVVVSLKEKLFEFPVIDNAYVLLEKK